MLTCRTPRPGRLTLPKPAVHQPYTRGTESIRGTTRGTPTSTDNNLQRTRYLRGITGADTDNSPSLQPLVHRWELNHSVQFWLVNAELQWCTDVQTTQRGPTEYRPAVHLRVLYRLVQIGHSGK